MNTDENSEIDWNDFDYVVYVGKYLDAVKYNGWDLKYASTELKIALILSWLMAANIDNL